MSLSKVIAKAVVAIDNPYLPTREVSFTVYFISDDMLYQLQILTNGEWENTVYPPTDWTVAQRRLSIYKSSFPEEQYALLEVPVV